MVTTLLPDQVSLAGICARVAAFVDTPIILEFCEFIAANAGDCALPDYGNIDLMQVPRLAPHIFVHDYREGTKQGLRVKFSGTAIDEHYGQVLQGRFVEDVYTGADADDRYFPLHRRAIAMRRPFLALRQVSFDLGTPRERMKRSTTLYFPCASKGASIEFGIGAVVFEAPEGEIEPVYEIL